MDEILYMKVTRDEYELPMAVATSPEELARILDVKKKSILDGVYRRNKYGSKSQYVKVLINEEV